MAEVYLAIAGGPGGFNKLQVLKVLRPDLNEQERSDFLQMFQDEGRLAARLNHPNIVQSHEIGFEEGHHFIAMEYLDGQPLSRVQDRGWGGGPTFPLEMQLFVLAQVLEGLEYAHNLRDYDGTPLNIVHRDVSPQNIFITYTGHTKLVDFGIAKTLESCKTRAGVVKGKVPYMSPEQVLGSGIDHRADLFSVGVILWESIAARHMHGTQTMYEILRRLVQGDLPQIRDVVPGIPAGLDRIVTRALSLKPADRYPDARAFRDELLGYLDQSRKFGAREVGERVASLFAEERREINEVIRRAMTEPAERDVTPGQINALHLLPTLVVLGGSNTTTSTTAPTTTPVAHSPAPTPVNRAMSTPAPSSVRKRWIFALAAVAIVSAVASIAFALRSSREPTANPPLASLPAPDSPVQRPAAAEPPAAPNTTKPAAPVADPQSTAKASTVQVRIHVEPSGASLVLDGEALSENPYRGERPRDAASHTLLARAPGYRERTLQLRFDHDIDLAVSLAESAAKPSVPSELNARVKPPARAPSRTGSDAYVVDLPAPNRPKAPPLDTSNPW